MNFSARSSAAGWVSELSLPEKNVSSRPQAARQNGGCCAECQRIHVTIARHLHGHGGDCVSCVGGIDGGQIDLCSSSRLATGPRQRQAFEAASAAGKRTRIATCA